MTSTSIESQNRPAERRPAGTAASAPTAAGPGRLHLGAVERHADPEIAGHDASVRARLVGVAVGEERDVARLDHRHGRPEADERRIAMADGDRERHVGRLAGRAGAAVVEVEVAVDVGQARGPRVGRPERGGDARDERAAAAEDDREGPAADERRDAVADAFARRDDGRVADDPALGSRSVPTIRHVEIAAVARPEDLRDRPASRSAAGASSVPPGFPERVDRDADHDDVSPVHAAPRTPPTKARAGQRHAVPVDAGVRAGRVGDDTRRLGERRNQPAHVRVERVVAPAPHTERRPGEGCRSTRTRRRPASPRG